MHELLMMPTGMQIPRISAKLGPLEGAGTDPPLTFTYDVMIGMLAIVPVSREFCKA